MAAQAEKKSRTTSPADAAAAWWLTSSLSVAEIQSRICAAHAQTHGGRVDYVVTSNAGWIYGTFDDVSLDGVLAWISSVTCYGVAWNATQSDASVVAHNVSFSDESLEQYGNVSGERGRTTEFNAAVDLALPNGLVFWLDMVLPMYSKARVMPLAYVGVLLGASENKPRFRVLSIFRRQQAVDRPRAVRATATTLTSAESTTSDAVAAVAARYNRAAAIDGRPPLHLSADAHGRTVFSGKWMCGNDYRNKTTYHGAYPASLLERYETMLPTRGRARGERVLHIFSGSLPCSKDYIRLDAVQEAELRGNAESLATLAGERAFDIIFADPPYSLPDAIVYKNAALVDRSRVLAACAHVLAPGGWLVWLDCVTWSQIVVPPTLRIAGLVTLIRSTNHRFRLITFFHKS